MTPPICQHPTCTGRKVLTISGSDSWHFSCTELCWSSAAEPYWTLLYCKVLYFTVWICPTTRPTWQDWQGGVPIWGLRPLPVCLSALHQVSRKTGLIPLPWQVGDSGGCLLYGGDDVNGGCCCRGNLITGISALKGGLLDKILAAFRGFFNSENSCLIWQNMYKIAAL